MIRLLAPTLLFNFAATVTAQILSSECINAINQVGANPDVDSCLTPGPLLPLASGNESTLVIEPINDWLGSMCSAAPCTNETLAAIVRNVTIGCETDLRKVSHEYDPNRTPSIISLLLQDAYPTIRKVLCLQNGDTKCLTEGFNTLQSGGITGSDGGLSLKDMPAVINNFILDPERGAFGSHGLLKNISCSDCAKAAINTVEDDFPGLIFKENGSFNKTYIANACGASFVDGQDPDGITQTASDAPAGSAEGASSGTEGNSAVTLSGGFAGPALTAGLLVAVVL
ncbi:hypothetical protein Moror_7688 [Moniliophthora roreri MCA 2997]|uniref:Uncharacterized protein n=1 Tax=Moniliophthora roreri (strain MCA 2997) TaxID=1381753 RepID=V2YEX7_MONRO|nr:hypothetical protein Moror_7688 [Moniliophthora roreri MCA 2997]